MLKMQQMLSKFFDNREVEVIPDQNAVVKGAAYQSGIIKGQGGKTLDDVMLLDAYPNTISYLN